MCPLEKGQEEKEKGSPGDQLEPVAIPIPSASGEGDPGDAMASALPPVGTSASNTHLEWWDLALFHMALGLMLTLILELWFHGEEVPTPLPWLIPTEASHCSGRCVEREWPVECAWNQVHITAVQLAHLGMGHSQCWTGTSWNSRS